MGHVNNARGRRAAPAESSTPQAPAIEAASEAVEPPTPPARNRPVHVERIGNIRAGIWANDGGQAGVYFTVTPSRIYKDGQDRWQSTDRFGRDDLLILAKVLDRAHSWICDTQQHPAPPTPAVRESSA
jgi:hypothetical protein